MEAKRRSDESSNDSRKRWQDEKETRKRPADITDGGGVIFGRVAHWRMTEAINSMASVRWQLQLRFSSHLYRYDLFELTEEATSLLTPSTTVPNTSPSGPASNHHFRVKWSCDERGPAQLAIVLTGCPLESCAFVAQPLISIYSFDNSTSKW